MSEDYRQECWNDTDWLYIQGLSKAIDKVPKSYIREKEDKRKFGKFHLERIFSYELYYRWTKMLHKKGENPENLFLNAELSKHYDDKKECKFPDMVLHGDFTNCNKQFIICEIKSSRNYIKSDYLKKDVESLYRGVKNLGYHCGVFIYIGDGVDSITSRLRSLFQTYENYEEGKYLFIGVNCNQHHYEIL